MNDLLRPPCAFSLVRNDSSKHFNECFSKAQNKVFFSSIFAQQLYALAVSRRHRRARLHGVEGTALARVKGLAPWV